MLRDPWLLAALDHSEETIQDTKLETSLTLKSKINLKLRELHFETYPDNLGLVITNCCRTGECLGYKTKNAAYMKAI